ncbi:PREDICTED: putative F-box/kelch-repeat protein At5g24040 [Brassica oleracea var. oleracea]|uniref:putative F-box/kelch-repeat protein At5g24040 n=1 Tax=Brassica oleracea var. oleracea TaxID=109376 RepID=UPI0006A6F4BC|nr:PREDICTED: putative F-box/kelch-repeat protein At5g24040 [Brassica oleracea var. oleracea]
MWDWSEMLPDIIHMISLKIDNPFDLIHFRSVCSWWRASSLPTFRQIPSPRCPLPPDVGGCGDDCHIVRSRVYLVNSFSCDPPQFCTRRGECSYQSLSLDLLNTQVIELGQEQFACYTYWCNLFDSGFPYKGEESIGFMQ